MSGVGLYCERLRVVMVLFMGTVVFIEAVVLIVGV